MKPLFCLLIFLLPCLAFAQTKKDSICGTYKREPKSEQNKTLCVQRIIVSKKNKIEFQNDTILQNGFFFRVKKGTWEMKGDFMSGSFINYAVMNPRRKEFIIIEGFCYAPSTDKRDLMHELKSIIRSMKTLR